MKHNVLLSKADRDVTTVCPREMRCCRTSFQASWCHWVTAAEKGFALRRPPRQQPALAGLPGLSPAAASKPPGASSSWPSSTQLLSLKARSRGPSNREDSGCSYPPRLAAGDGRGAFLARGELFVFPVSRF